MLTIRYHICDIILGMLILDLSGRSRQWFANRKWELIVVRYPSDPGRWFRTLVTKVCDLAHYALHQGMSNVSKCRCDRRSSLPRVCVFSQWLTDPVVMYLTNDSRILWLCIWQMTHRSVVMYLTNDSRILWLCIWPMTHGSHGQEFYILVYIIYQKSFSYYISLHLKVSLNSLSNDITMMEGE